MKNLIKISLITSMLLSSQLMAWSEAETETKVNANQTQLNSQQLQIDDLDEYKLDKVEFYPTRDLAIQNQTRLDSKDIVDNQQTSDIAELFNRTLTNSENYTTLQDEVNNIKSQNFATEQYVDDEIETLNDEIYGWTDVETTTNALGQTIETETESEGSIFEILNGQKRTTTNVTTGEIIEDDVTIKKGLIELSEENVVKDNQQDIDIANNTTLATDARARAITANTKADNAISQNTTQDSQITNNANKDIAQDVVINQAVNDINVEKTRNDNQDIVINDNRNAIQSNNVRIDTFDSRITSNTNRNDVQDSRLDNHEDRITNLEKNASKDLEKTLMNERALTRKLINKGIAMNNAMNIPLAFNDSDKMIGLGIGAYNGEYALGSVVAWKYENTIISIKAGVDGDKNVGANASITIGF